LKDRGAYCGFCIITQETRMFSSLRRPISFGKSIYYTSPLKRR